MLAPREDRPLNPGGGVFKPPKTLIPHSPPLHHLHVLDKTAIIRLLQLRKNALARQALRRRSQGLEGEVWGRRAFVLDAGVFGGGRGLAEPRGGEREH